mmetsp:Transcript_11787/g.21542  ORF Transcript_11787/g.21542 Transcript_11787/m.21542 type:complete len:147 (+) Transcript_11787:362-802(+)
MTFKRSTSSANLSSVSLRSHISGKRQRSRFSLSSKCTSENGMLDSLWASDGQRPQPFSMVYKSREKRARIKLQCEVCENSSLVHGMYMFLDECYCSDQCRDLAIMAHDTAALKLDYEKRRSGNDGLLSSHPTKKKLPSSDNSTGSK